MTTLLALNEVMALHAAALAEFGGQDGVRDAGMIDSALLQPLQTFGGQELYPTVWDKAAVLARSLVSNHGFIDGNKRVGFAAMVIALRRGGYDLQCSVDEGEQLTLSIAKGECDWPEVSRWLQAHSVPAT